MIGSVLLATALLSGPSAPRHPAMHYDRYHNDYTQAFVSKIFLRARKAETCVTTMDQCREIVRKTWEVSGGIHQIIYLVGWQHEGHDSKFPSWDVVGEQCKSSWSQDPLESLRMFMREAREKYNCDVSLHLNMNDAHPDSPLWQTYVDNKLLCLGTDGKPMMLDGGAYKWYRISHLKEWKAGFAQKRIDALLKMIPELKDAKSVHIDAFFGQASPGDGITVAQDNDAVKAITDYWHEKGLDVTNEFITSEDMVGYFPMVYHYNLDERQRMLYPVDVVAPGDDIWNVRAGRDYFGRKNTITAPVDSSPASGSYYEEAWGLGCFCDLFPMYLAYQNLTRELFRKTFLFTWYNRHPLVEHVVTATDYKVRRADGVEASVRMRDRHLTVTQNGRVVVDGGDSFLDQAWNGGVILTYSAAGCDRDFDLPSDWKGVTELVGTRYPGLQPWTLPVKDGRVRVKLAAQESAVLRRGQKDVGARSGLVPFPTSIAPRFNPHNEHPGGKGGFAVSNGVYVVDYDYTDGGHGVGVEFPFAEPVWAERLELDVCFGERQRVGVVVLDSTGQSFFKAAPTPPAGAWRHHVCDLLSGWECHWGGPGDGVVRPPFRQIAVNLDRLRKGQPGPGEKGRSYFRNLAYAEIPVARRRVEAVQAGGVRYLVSDFRRGADRFSAGPRMFFVRDGDYRDGTGTVVTGGVVTNDFGKRPTISLCNEVPVWGRPVEFLLTVEAPVEAAGLEFAMNYASGGWASVPFGRLRKPLAGEKTICQTFSVPGPGGEGWKVPDGPRKMRPDFRSRRVMSITASRAAAPAKTFAVRFVRLEAVVCAGMDLPPLLATPPTGADAPRELEVGYLNLDAMTRADVSVRVALRDWAGNPLGEASAQMPATASGARSFVRVPLPETAARLNYVQYTCEAWRDGRRDRRIPSWEASWTRPWSGEGTTEKRPDLPWGFGVYIHRSEAFDAFASGYETPTNAASVARMEQRAALARKAGMKWERIELKPSQIEWRKGAYDFSGQDRILDAADRNGLSYYICCSHYWPAGYKAYTKEAYDEWAKVIGLAVRRYRGRCRHWEIWNEPNIENFWKGTAEDYVYLANAAYDEIKRADPESVVVACSTAGVDLGFIDRCIALGLKYDSASIHPYRAEPVEEPFLADLAATTNRTRGAKTYLTELGWPTGCDRNTYLERTQAGWFVRNYLSAAGSGTPLAINGYDFIDDGFNVLERENNFGVLRRDLTPKPAYRALATLCTFFSDGVPALERKELTPDCRAWIFRMGGKAALWTSSPADLAVRCAAPATVRNPMDEIVGEKVLTFKVRTDGRSAVFVDRDVTSVEGRPVSGNEPAVIAF